jgi:hypothetical protein
MRKIIVKRVSFILFIAALAGILFFDKSDVIAYSTGPDPAKTGAPNEQTCAVAECHGTTINQGGGKFVIIAPERYEPGGVYQITIKHQTEDESRRRWGFQFTSLTQSAEKAGELQPQDAMTQVIADFGRQYIQHNLSGTFQGQQGEVNWSFLWMAPPTNVGTITFYAAGNQADNNGSNSGDRIYTTKALIIPALPDSPSALPKITNAFITGKQLIVMGTDFDQGATLWIDNVKQKKTFNDEVNPATILVARKAGKQIASRQVVILQVKNLDGTLSEPFIYTRP